jgi:hypothetical protein
MDKMNNQPGSAIVNVLRSGSVVSLSKEYLELGIDTMLESGALKDIPLVNTVVGIFSASAHIRNQLLTTKLLRFLNQLSEVSEEDRISMVDKLNADDKFSGRVGAFLIEILDRMESEKKPELAAKFFAAYAREEISYEELRHILHALERVPSFDMDKLRQFAKVTIQDAMKMDESLLLAFVNAGLGVNNGGFSGGAVMPTGLCKLFVRIGLVS